MFTHDDELHAIATGLMDRTLPKPSWTHAAHLAAGLWITARCPHLDPERDMPGLIRAYNEATGVPNSETRGYHETITLASLRAIAAWLDRMPPGTPPFAACNALLESRWGKKDWPLAHWSPELLFSPLARREWVEPDRAPLRFD
jgi:hypothetical protein